MKLYSFLKLGLKVFSTNFGFFNPYELNFAITYKCNSRCKTCNIWKIRSENELSIKEIEKFSQQIKFINWIRLTGGEPFLRDDYEDIVKLLNFSIPHFFLLTTPTNGLLPNLIYGKVKKVLKFFRKKYIITVSLDGPIDIHDEIRGIKGSWQRAVETYKKLKKLEKKYGNFKVFFGYTMSLFNAGFFEKTFRMLKKEIPELTIDDIHTNLFQTSAIYYRIKGSSKNEKDCRRILKQEVINALELKKKLLNPISLIERKYLRLGKKYLETGKTPIKCNIFNLSCFVSPYGDIYPCTIFDRKLGTLRENNYDLKKILRSNTAKKIKREIIQNKCPQCWTPCEAHQLIMSNWFQK